VCESMNALLAPPNEMTNGHPTQSKQKVASMGPDFRFFPILPGLLHHSRIAPQKRSRVETIRAGSKLSLSLHFLS